MTRLASLLCLFALVACKKREQTPPPPPLPMAHDGEECALGGTNTHACPVGMRCAPRPVTATAPSVAPGVRPPNAEGHPCGGIAGYVCADGLGCAMSDEQKNAADGMGTCTRLSVCTR